MSWRIRSDRVHHSLTTWGLDFDQFNDLAAGTFDHQRASVAERAWLFHNRHAFPPQLGQPQVQIRYAQRDVVGQMTLRARQRPVSLTRVPVERDVTECDAR